MIYTVGIEINNVVTLKCSNFALHHFFVALSLQFTAELAIFNGHLHQLSIATTVT